MSWSPEKIQQLRLGLGWSAADFSRRLAVSCEAVIAWECGMGSPTPDDLRQIERLAFYLDSYSSLLERASSSEALLATNNYEQVHRNDLHALIKD